jgi:hypothetical protein
VSQDVASDVKQGVVAAWAADPALAARVPVASVYSGGVPGGPQPPYASLEVQPQGREYGSPVQPGTPHLDRQRLTVRVWASGRDAEAAAGEIALLALAALGDEQLWTVPDSVLVAVMPGGELHAEEDGEYHGNPVWRADVPLDLTLQRWLPYPGRWLVGHVFTRPVFSFGPFPRQVFA